MAHLRTTVQLFPAYFPCVLTGGGLNILIAEFQNVFFYTVGTDVLCLEGVLLPLKTASVRERNL
jgi:hypothetical protein